MRLTKNPRLVYVASSWRNYTRHAEVVRALEDFGHSVYDFRNPPSGTAFSFHELADAMEREKTYSFWNHEVSDSTDFRDIINHPMCKDGFNSDMQALMNAEVVVLVLPCERDAHLELGYAVGAGKETHILLDNPCKASLMYRMVDHLHSSLDDLKYSIGGPEVVAS